MADNDEQGQGQVQVEGAVAAAAPQLKTGRKIQFETSREVYFPHDHVQYHPWGATPPEDAPLMQLPVRRVCHVTHQQQAEDIGNNGFKPRVKHGKSKNGGDHPYGVSYRCTIDQIPDAETPCYQHILPNETVLPGRYSWWGLSVAQADIPNVEWGQYYRPGYLKDPPESIYGTRAFVSSFPDLLQRYADTRGCGLGEICLRMGGTLRYWREIAYVVILCKHTELKEYSPITYASRVFDPNGLLDNEGRVREERVESNVPQFTTRHYKLKGKRDNYSHETLDFALYLPNNMTCDIEPEEIDHDSKFCSDIRQRRCPDNP